MGDHGAVDDARICFPVRSQRGVASTEDIVWSTLARVDGEQRCAEGVA
jgi:hypothetical protein